MKGIAVALLWISWSGMLQGQYNFSHFSHDLGLPSDFASSLLLDRSGFLWVATSEGVCRFDGKYTLCFDHPGDNFPDLGQSDEFELYEDRGGVIWIGTRDQGLYSYDPFRKKSRHFMHREDEPGTLSDNFTNFIFEDRQGRLWIGAHSHGLDLYDQEAGSFRNFRPSSAFPGLVPRLADDLICFELDPQNDSIIWLGSLAGIFSFNTLNFSWKYFPVEKEGALDKSLYSGSEKVIRSIVFDGTGHIWAGTWGGGLICYDPVLFTYNIFKYEQTEPVNGFRNNIKQVEWKDPATLWIVAPYRGLGLFHVSAGSYEFMDYPENGTPVVENPVRMLLDGSGFVWVASRSRGLYYFNLKVSQFHKIPLPYSLNNLVAGPAPGSVLASVAGPVSRLIEISAETGATRVYSYKPLNDVQENSFAGIIPDNGKAWIAESFNLYVFDGASITPFYDFVPAEVSHHKQSQPFFISMTRHTSGDLWLGTKFHGLFRVNAGDGMFRNYYAADRESNTPGLDEFIYCLYADPQGRIWFGSEHFGFYDYSTNRFMNYVASRDVRGTDMEIRYVQSIVQTNDGCMWFGTEKNGIAVLMPRGDSLSFVASYTERNGLACNDIRELAVDAEGCVWAITGEGLSRIRRGTGSVENYGFQHGLSALHGIAALPDGNMMVGSDHGYYLFDPSRIYPVDIPSNPYIRSISVFDVPVNFRQLLDSAGCIDLKHDQNFFTIEFGLVDYINSPGSKLFYRMEGLDQDWQEAPSSEHISYANLPGGSYLFRLKSSGGEELVLPILIGTPFWKTTWFYLVLAMILAAGLSGLYMFRLRQVRKQEAIKSEYNRMINELEMKALRSQMNPHFLFNSLNSIRYYILKEEFEHASDYITRFSKLLRFILRNSRQSMITLKEELDTLQIYIDFEQMRFGKSFTYACRTDPSVDPEAIMVQPMTLQPFVENAIWHGLMPKENNRVLTLDISRVDSLVKIIIEDNGVGRNARTAMPDRQEISMTETKSFGLQITGERFALHSKVTGKRSDFEIADLSDHQDKPAGTRVTIHHEL